MNKKVLIITDIQNDFCPGGSLAVENGDKIIPIINKLSHCGIFDKIVATQDWHPQNHLSFASNQDNHEAYDIIKSQSGDDVSWPDHCIMGTKGAEFHPDLEVDIVDLIIRKGMNPNLDSYSTFLENDENTPTGLTGYLKEHEITDVYLCGIATDVCVYNSALDSVNFGFNTYVVLDASSGVDLPPGNLDKAITHMKTLGINFLESKDLGV